MPSGAGQLKHLRLFSLAGLLWLAAALCAQAAPQLERTAELTWHIDAPWFGGFSGIEVLDNGTTLLLITDKGRIINAQMQRDETGALTAISDTTWRKLRYRNGIGVKGPFTDSEGLALTPDGRMFVTFELRHRMAEVDPATGIMTPLPGHADFAGFGENSGLEALALHPDGRLFALPERSASRHAPFNLNSFDGTRWRITGQLARRGPFQPVGADFDANGTL